MAAVEEDDALGAGVGGDDFAVIGRRNEVIVLTGENDRGLLAAAGVGDAVQLRGNLL